MKTHLYWGGNSGILISARCIGYLRLIGLLCLNIIEFILGILVLFVRQLCHAQRYDMNKNANRNRMNRNAGDTISILNASFEESERLPDGRQTIDFSIFIIMVVGVFILGSFG